MFPKYPARQMGRRTKFFLFSWYFLTEYLILCNNLRNSVERNFETMPGRRTRQYKHTEYVEKSKMRHVSTFEKSYSIRVASNKILNLPSCIKVNTQMINLTINVAHYETLYWHIRLECYSNLEISIKMFNTIGIMHYRWLRIPRNYDTLYTKS